MAEPPDHPIPGATPQAASSSGDPSPGPNGAQAANGALSLTGRPLPAVSTPTRELVRVQLDEENPTFEDIRVAIYAQAKAILDRGEKMRTLVLSRDIYEILNRRLVFTTAAHKELPHFITPYGNLRVILMEESLGEPLSFVIQS